MEWKKQCLAGRGSDLRAWLLFVVIVALPTRQKSQQPLLLVSYKGLWAQRLLLHWSMWGNALWRCFTWTHGKPRGQVAYTISKCALPTSPGCPGMEEDAGATVLPRWPFFCAWHVLLHKIPWDSGTCTAAPTKGWSNVSLGRVKRWRRGRD